MYSLDCVEKNVKVINTFKTFYYGFYKKKYI